MVGPQKLKPSAFSAFDIVRETSVSVAMPARLRGRALDRRPVDEVPQEAREAGAALLDPSQARAPAIVADDLGAVADDAGVAHQPLDVGLA